MALDSSSICISIEGSRNLNRVYSALCASCSSSLFYTHISSSIRIPCQTTSHARSRKRAFPSRHGLTRSGQRARFFCISCTVAPSNGHPLSDDCQILGSRTSPRNIVASVEPPLCCRVLDELSNFLTWIWEYSVNPSGYLHSIGMECRSSVDKISNRF